MRIRAEGQISRGGAEGESAVEGTQSESQTEQYSLAKILGIWAAAALPMGALAWVVAPWLAGLLDGPVPMARALLSCLTVGLIWQFVLVMVLVYRERGSLRWPVLKDALWLRSPRSPRTGRVGGRLWLVLIPCLLLFGVQEFIPSFPPATGHDLPAFIESDAAAAFFSGNWVWYAHIAVQVVFVSALGEELLFRGLLLPRMRGVFGRGDFVANGVLFAFYHLHMPWVIPATLLDIFALSYPSRRYRSALIGIAVHSAQSVVVLVLILPLVLR
jgi:CAAX protease family protein